LFVDCFIVFTFPDKIGFCVWLMKSKRIIPIKERIKKVFWWFILTYILNDTFIYKFGFCSFKMGVAEQNQQVGARLQDIRNRVGLRQGEAVLVYRDILAKEAKGCFGVPQHYYHSEIGVLEGDLVEKRFDGVTNIFDDLQEINVGVIWQPHSRGEYSFWRQYKIPVKLGLAKGGIGLTNLRFSPEDLKSFKERNICFSEEELGERPYIFGYTPGMPCLEEIRIGIGDEEVRALINEKNLCLETEADELFDLLKKPGKIERVVEEYDAQQRGKLARGLVQDVARLCLVSQGISDLEESVLNAKAFRDTDEDGRYPFVAWRDISKKSVEGYSVLSKDAEELQKKILVDLEKAEADFDLSKIGVIRGFTVGFDSSLDYGFWKESILEKVMPGLNLLIGKLDSHLGGEAQRIREEIEKGR